MNRQNTDRPSFLSRLSGDDPATSSPLFRSSSLRNHFISLLLPDTLTHSMSRSPTAVFRVPEPDRFPKVWIIGAAEQVIRRVSAVVAFRQLPIQHPAPIKIECHPYDFCAPPVHPRTGQAVCLDGLFFKIEHICNMLPDTCFNTKTVEQRLMPFVIHSAAFHHVSVEMQMPAAPEQDPSRYQI